MVSLETITCLPGLPLIHRCFATLAGIVSDYRGLQKHLGIKASPAIWACFKCWQEGVRVGQKTVYTNHHHFLPIDDELRTALQFISNARQALGDGNASDLEEEEEVEDREEEEVVRRGEEDREEEDGVATGEPRPRTTEEMRQGINVPPAADAPILGSLTTPWRVTSADPRGVACPLYDLESFDPVHFVQYDGMHTLGGIIKDVVVKGIQGLRVPSAQMVIYNQAGGVTILSKSG